MRPVPKDLMSADEKELRQSEICRKSGEMWDEHTRSLPELKVEDFVQLIEQVWLRLTMVIPVTL